MIATCAVHCLILSVWNQLIICKHGGVLFLTKNLSLKEDTLLTLWGQVLGEPSWVFTLKSQCDKPYVIKRNTTDLHAASHFQGHSHLITSDLGGTEIQAVHGLMGVGWQGWGKIALSLEKFKFVGHYCFDPWKTKWDSVFRYGKSPGPRRMKRTLLWARNLHEDLSRRVFLVV